MATDSHIEGGKGKIYVDAVRESVADDLFCADF